MSKDLNKPLTKKELKDLQKKQPGSSPYLPGKAPFKQAKKNKKSKPLTEKSDKPYGQPEKATNDPNDNKRTYFT